MTKIRRMVVIAALCSLAPLVHAAEGLPQGKWWERPEVIRTLSLSQEQQNQLDATYMKNANALIDQRAQIEKDTLALRSELDKGSLDRKSVQAAAGRLSASRAKLFEQELMMLVDMRDVLTVEQWNQLRTQLERRRQGMENRKGGSPAPQRRPRQP